MRLQEIRDNSLNQHLDEISRDGMDVFLLNEGAVRGAVLNGTQLVNQMRANHELGVLETLLLGHSYLAAGLLTSQMKSRDRMSLSFQSDGPVGGITVESNVHGEVRGYLRNDSIELEGPLESFDTGPFIGDGFLSVTRFPQGAHVPYTGQVELEYRSIAKDLANYFLRSEQTPTAFNLSIQFDEEGRATGAGGLLVQAMPDATDETRTELEEIIRDLPSLGRLFASGDTTAHVVHTHFAEFSPDIVGTRSVEFSCPCSRERFARFLVALGPEELEDIEEHGPLPLRTTCWNCGSTYEFNENAVADLRREAGRRAG
ncbi:MAG: Hsp33 family molecular chaperone HslO [Spirochaetaceae bacterium]